MSNIDPTKPEAGQATTQSVRDNFQAAKDEIEALEPGGGQSFTDYLAGYLDTGFTEQFVGDCDDIAVNSRYRATSNSATNLPSDADSTQIYIETIMQANTSSGMQYVYGQKGTNLYKIWTRTLDSTVWGAWKLVVDGGAFPQRLAGYEDTGFHTFFTGDLNTIVTNSVYEAFAGSVTNAPADMTSVSILHTDASFDGANIVQVMYGVNTEPYHQWMRSSIDSGANWQPWKLVVDGGAFTQRLAGYEDTGLPAQYLSDLNLLITNSVYIIRGDSVTNEPADMVGTQWGTITTYPYLDAGVERYTQVIHGMNVSNGYRIWMRWASGGVWEAWKRVVDGNLLTLPLPTSDPLVSGALWNNGGVVNVST